MRRKRVSVRLPPTVALGLVLLSSTCCSAFRAPVVVALKAKPVPAQIPILDVAALRDPLMDPSTAAAITGETGPQEAQSKPEDERRPPNSPCPVGMEGQELMGPGMMAGTEMMGPDMMAGNKMMSPGAGSSPPRKYRLRGSRFRAAQGLLDGPIGPLLPPFLFPSLDPAEGEDDRGVQVVTYIVARPPVTMTTTRSINRGSEEDVEGTENGRLVSLMQVLSEMADQATRMMDHMWPPQPRHIIRHFDELRIGIPPPPPPDAAASTAFVPVVRTSDVTEREIVELAREMEPFLRPEVAAEEEEETEPEVALGQPLKAGPPPAPQQQHHVRPLARGLLVVVLTGAVLGSLMLLASMVIIMYKRTAQPLVRYRVELSEPLLPTTATSAVSE